MSRLFAGTSFDQPKPCAVCRELPAKCRCLKLPEKKRKPEGQLDSGLRLTPENAAPPKDQLAIVSTEKRKGGRVVTLVSGLAHPANDLPKLCTELKTLLGTGGSVQERTVEIQGDHAQAVERFLIDHDIKARRR